MSKIEIIDEIQIDEYELQFDYVRSSGPGGQNVNKVSSAVQLRFDVVNSESLPEEVKIRLMKYAKNRINQDGVLIIDARNSRSQEANRKTALNRLTSLIKRAAKKEIPRRPTQPSAAAKRRRLKDKRRRSDIKRLRGKIEDW